MSFNANEIERLFSNAKFNLSGLFVFTPLLLQLIDVVNEKYGYRLPVKSIHGSPCCIWNGGRSIINRYGFIDNDDAYFREFEKLKLYSIKPVLTFSNHIITEIDLDDVKCNRLLQIISYYNGGVIVSSKRLKKYIARCYPQLTIHASAIIPALELNVRTSNYYNLLSEQYESIVLHPDDNFDNNILKFIDTKKVEILLNERCMINCNKRQQHYESISLHQKNKNLSNCFMDNCTFLPLLKQKHTNIRNISLSINEVRTLYDIGFYNYKLQGRDENPYLYIFDVIRYMLDSNLVAPAVYSIMTYIIHDYINKDSYDFC